MKRKWFALGAAAVALAVAVTVGVVLPSFAQGPSWDQGGGGFPPAGGWYGWQAMTYPFGTGGSMLGTIAKALGMNASDLQTELQAGKSVADVAQEKNVPLDTVVNAMLADIRTNLTQLLQTKPGTGGFFGFGPGYGYGPGGMTRNFGPRGPMHRFGPGFFGGWGTGPGAGQSTSPTPTPQSSAIPQSSGANL